MNLKYLIHILIFFSSYSFAEDSTYFKIQNHFSEKIPSDFFIFKIAQNTGSNSNKNILFIHYNSIKNTQYCNDIFFILDDVYSDSSNVIEYFESVLNLKLTQKEKSRIIINHSIYNSLNSLTYLSHLYYVHKKQLFYNFSLKLAEPITNILPHDIFAIIDNTKNKIISLPTISTIADVFIKINENNFLLLCDNSNKVWVIDKNSLEIKKTLTNNFNSVDLYSKYITKDKKEIEFAKEHSQELKESNRNDFNIYNAFSDGTDIYFYIGIQVFEPNKKKFEYYNEKGEKAILKKGEAIGELHGLLMKVDSNLQNPVFYNVDDLPSKISAQIYSAPENVMYIDRELLFSINLADEKIKEEKANKGVSIYIFGSNKAHFYTLGECPLVENYQFKSSYAIGGSFFKTKDSTYVIYHTSPYIYNVFKKEPINKLSGDSTVSEPLEVYKKHITDTVKTKINYFYRGSGKIKDHFFAIIYENSSKTFFEIFDANFRKLQLIDITNLPKGKYLINNDELLIFEFIKGKYKIHYFPITFNK